MFRKRPFSEHPKRAVQLREGVLSENRVSGVGDSRKLNIYHYSCSKTLHMGSLMCGGPGIRKTSCPLMGFPETELPPRLILGNSGTESREDGLPF